MAWRAVKSNKPQRKGEAFVMRDDVFVLKVYAGSVPDTLEFAQYLARQFQQLQDKKESEDGNR